jgi:anaerobic dimethyl sulfoxide reductase subunit A
MSDSKDQSALNKASSRRSMLKWTGALAAAGVVGVGLGVGGDMLLRSSTTTTTVKTSTVTATVTAPAQTQTTTQTVGTTVTQAPVPLSYVPPLSPSVQQKVTATINNLVGAHSGDTVVYATISSATMGGTDVSKVHIKNGVLLSVEPDDLVNPTVGREDAVLSQADLIAAKIRGTPAQQQYSFPAWINDPARILYPMMRAHGATRGDPNGQFIRITWDQAISSFASEISKCATTYGPNSVFLPGAFYFFGMWFGWTLPLYVGTGVGPWGNVSFGAQQFAETFCYGAAGLAGSFTGAEAASTVDTFNSKLIILWGHDPTTALGSWGGNAMTYYYRLAKEKGIPIIVIDPKYTMAAETLSSQWIPIRPTTDLAMGLAIANVLFKNNLYDSNFVSKYVEPTGFQKWKDYVLGNTAGPDGAVDRTPEWAAPICGIPAASITALAKLYASSKPVWLALGMGPNRQTDCTELARVGTYLQAMTGNVGIAGGNASYCSYNATNGMFAPGPDYGQKPAKFGGSVGFIGYKWADAVLLGTQYAAGKITKEQYFSAIGAPLTNPTPNLKLVVFTSGTGAQQTPNINKSIAAVQQMEMAVAMLWHWNTAAKISDLVLPLAEFFEYNMGFLAVPGGFVYVPKLIEPQGEAKNPDWINIKLANALGVGDQWAPLLQNVSDADFDSTEDSIMKTAYESWAANAAVAKVLGTVPTWEQFLQKPVIRTPNVVALPFSDQISGGKPFATTSGKIEFYSSHLADLYSNWDQSKVDFNLQIGAPISPMAMYLQPTQGFFDPGLKTYPLVMIGTHNRYHGHSFQSDNPMLRGDLYEHSLWISVADASARNINDGDQIQVFNDAGTLVVPAYVTSRVVPGTVHLYDGAWAKPDASGIDMGGCSNSVFKDTFNPVGEDPHNVLVEVKKF